MKYKKCLPFSKPYFKIIKCIFIANCLLPIVYCLLPVTSFAQTDVAQKYASYIDRNDLKKHLSIIASAEMEGRETATPGQQRAAAYIEDQFKKIGLKHPSQLSGYQQQYPLFKDTLLQSSLKIGKNKYAFGSDYIIFAGTAEKEEIKSNQLVFIGYGIDDKNYDDYRARDVKGKVVVFFAGEPKINGKSLSAGMSRAAQWSLVKKTILAKQKGAAAALIINPSDSIPRFAIETAKRNNMYFPRPVTKENEKVSYALVVNHVGADILGTNMYNDLSTKARAGELLNTSQTELHSSVKLEYKKKPIPFYSTNIIGYLEGTDKKDEFVFLTGHYDHLGKRGDSVIFYGADDDGSGTTSVIEMAQAFAKAKAEGHGPRRTIVFMTVSGEEKGLWGSEYYTDHPLFPLEKTTVDLNTDMVGRVDPDRKVGDSTNYVYVVGDDKISSDLKTISEATNKKYANLELDYKYNDANDKERIYYRSDHYNFAKKGVPIIFYYDGMLRPDYHRPTDTVDKINFDLMEKRVRFIFLTAWDMANRDNMLLRDMPLPAMN